MQTAPGQPRDLRAVVLLGPPPLRRPDAMAASRPRRNPPVFRATRTAPPPARPLPLPRDTCQARAEALGPSTGAVIAELLASHPLDRFRTAVRILGLTDDFTPARLEAACTLGLAHGDPSYRTLKRLLRDGLESLPHPAPAAPAAETLVFAGSPEDLAQAILAGAAWT